MLLTLLFLIPRGVYFVGWYLQPLFVLLVSCLFGAVPGMAQASTVVIALFASASLTGRIPSAEQYGLSGIWVQVWVSGSTTVAMALCGMLLQRTLNLAMLAEEDQLQRMDEAMRALRHRENLLRHAMRIETVGEMSSMVVHELRNQFQLILGYAALGMKSADERATQHFKTIVDDAELFGLLPPRLFQQ